VAEQVIASELIAMARAKEEALEGVVREHARLVYRVAYAVVRNHHDAEDVAQETFLRVLKSRNKLGTVRDLKSWLARIAWRAAVDRRWRAPSLAIAEPDDRVNELQSDSSGAEEAVLAAEMKALLERLIVSLPRALRDVITLATVQELSIGDIARILDLSEAAVRSRLLRAREMLKRKMGSRLEGKHGRNA
jgi:RNA polymerase sigma-70 factor (ECF subfamily)